jgi:hypothetical protein
VWTQADIHTNRQALGRPASTGRNHSTIREPDVRLWLGRVRRLHKLAKVFGRKKGGVSIVAGRGEPADVPHTDSNLEVETVESQAAVE